LRDFCHKNRIDPSTTGSQKSPGTNCRRGF
jgi:hypothetical protein